MQSTHPLTITDDRRRRALPAGGILAGGEGRRFGGVDKGWLRYDGSAFVERVAAALAPQLGWLAISANRNLAAYAALGYPVLTDRIGAGPLAGLLRLLEAALAADSGEFLLSAPCDALNLPADLGLRMVQLQRQSGADIVVLADDAGLHPVVSLTRCTLAADLARHLQAGDYSVQRWQQRHRRVVAQLGGRLLNINDASALEAADA